MTNKEKYKFEDFTLANYARLIDIAIKKGFHFILHKDKYVINRKEIIWRHDVEFSPDIALQMAKIEHTYNVRTTYFFQLHSDYYNILSPHFTKVLNEINNLGHHIGLHFDCHYYNILEEEKLDSFICLDKEYFENSIGIKIDTFSFHNTNPFILNCNKKYYGGLINVYSSHFKKNYNYCADSTGIWRFERLEDVLVNDNIKHLQVLIHDAMWHNEVLSPHKRIMESIQANADRIKQEYADGIKKTGNINVDDDYINPIFTR